MKPLKNILRKGNFNLIIAIILLMGFNGDISKLWPILTFSKTQSLESG